MKEIIYIVLVIISIFIGKELTTLIISFWKLDRVHDNLKNKNETNKLGNKNN